MTTTILKPLTISSRPLLLRRLLPRLHNRTHHLHPRSLHTTPPIRSKPTSAVKTSQPPSTPLSIPGPSWLWVQPLTYPFRAYSRIQSRRPYVVQLLSSIIIYFLGDLSSQSIQNRGLALSPTEGDASGGGGNEGPHYDPQRAVRSVIIGAISSIPSYHFFLWLSRSFNYTGRPYTSLLTKVCVNQLTFAPLFNAYFFSMHSLLSPSEGPQPAAAWRRVCDTVPTSWWNSCHFWPVVTAFSFTFVPVQHRSVFAGVVAIGWQSYLGLLNQRAVVLERERVARMEVAKG